MGFWLKLEKEIIDLLLLAMSECVLLIPVNFYFQPYFAHVIAVKLHILNEYFN